MNADPTQRLDKWLWTARFYKTRSLAAAAIRGGKVAINNERVKPSKLINVGDSVKIRRGPYEFDITIVELRSRRGSAPEAAALYREAELSRERRVALSAQLRADANSRDLGVRGRPTKRNRRNLQKLKRLD
jgi:ribosome-associated heat shock protein Hsp15